MEEMIGNPKYVTEVKSPGLPIINPTDLVPTNGGVDFTKKQPEIIVKLTPGNEKTIFKIEFTNPDDNLKQVKVTLYPVDESKEPEVIPATSANQPIYPNSLEPVDKIKIEVVSTTDNKNPRNVEISVQSCSLDTTVAPLTTTTQPGKF